VGAGVEIAAAVRDLDDYGRVEVIIVGRGGGSREDLSAFNEEVVARAIVSSSVPVIAAVGHEIDLSIADLVADCRAPTPTAAAEMVVPRWEDLRQHVFLQIEALDTAMRRHMMLHHQVVLHLGKRLRDPRHRVKTMQSQVQMAATRLLTTVRRCEERAQWQLHELAAALNNLSPLAVLGRGYSLTRSWTTGKIVADATRLAPGDLVRLTFAKGEARAKIEEVNG
jgi:exodeoxyribonuclease VII large subunit